MESNGRPQQLIDCKLMSLAKRNCSAENMEGLGDLRQEIYFIYFPVYSFFFPCFLWDMGRYVSCKCVWVGTLRQCVCCCKFLVRLFVKGLSKQRSLVCCESPDIYINCGSILIYNCSINKNGYTSNLFKVHKMSLEYLLLLL